MLLVTWAILTAGRLMQIIIPNALFSQKACKQTRRWGAGQNITKKRDEEKADFAPISFADLYLDPN